MPIKYLQENPNKKKELYCSDHKLDEIFHVF